jgi:hypothetical protein
MDKQIKMKTKLTDLWENLINGHICLNNEDAG